MSSPSLLPPRFSADVLEGNLRALDEVAPSLAERLRLPVDDSRVRFDDDDRTWRVVHRTLLPLDVDPSTLEATIADLGSAPRVLVLGVGLGEAIDALLDNPATRQVTAWDRDPWLLRLYLMRRDRRQELRGGRLRLALCTDLLDIDPEGFARIEHPLLAGLYRGEIDLLDHPLRESRAILCTGGLFVQQLADAMRARGWDLWGLELRELAEAELSRCVHRFRPRLVVAINYTEGLAEFCARHGIRLLCWEVDPSLRPPLPREEPQDHVFVFTHRKANVPLYQAAGYPHVEYMPLAADPAVRRGNGLVQADREHLVSFVGASMVQTAREFRGRFIETFARWKGHSPGAAEEGAGLLSEIVIEQRRDPSRFCISGLLEERVPGFANLIASDTELADPVVLAGELAASEKRLSYVATLGVLGIRVWGDGGWKLIERHGVRYMGSAGHEDQLTEVYNRTRVNIDVGRIYQNDIVTMRVFDVLSCGSFLLAEHSEALEEVFEIGREVESYRTLDELRAKARYYLEHPAEAEEIAQRGREAVHQRHTIAQRFDHMMEAMA
jgi:hypothetical protein